MNVRSCIVDLCVSCKQGFASLINRVFTKCDRDVIWQQFEDKVADEDRKGNSDAQSVLLDRKTLRMEREESACVLDDQEVDNNNDHPNEDKGWVIEETLKDVLFVMDLAGSNHVDDLKPDK